LTEVQFWGQACGVPVEIARHLRVLSHQDMAHDIVVPESEPLTLIAADRQAVGKSESVRV